MRAAFNATKPRRLHHGGQKDVLRTMAARAMTFVAEGKRKRKPTREEVKSRPRHVWRLFKKKKRVLLGVVRWCRTNAHRQSFSRHKVSQVVLSGQLLTVWMILKSENDQRTTHFALTSPSHHQSGLGVVVSTFSKAEQWVVVSSSFLPATFSSMHTALQSLTKVAHFSLRARNFSVCRSTQRALVPSVLCELTLPAVPTPP